MPGDINCAYLFALCVSQLPWCKLIFIGNLDHNTINYSKFIKNIDHLLGCVRENFPGELKKINLSSENHFIPKILLLLFLLLFINLYKLNNNCHIRISEFNIL